MKHNTNKMKLALVSILTCLMVSCGEDPVSIPTPTPTPTPGILPEANSPIGSGSGVSTILVSPTEIEITAMKLINELRTMGTINGNASVRQGTCMEQWQPLRGWNYSGVLAKAARNHSTYMAHEGYEAHSESKTSSPYFTGATAADRVNFVAQQNNMATTRPGEAAAAGYDTPESAVIGWLKSPPHCALLNHPTSTHMGLGSEELNSYRIWILVMGNF